MLKAQKANRVVRIDDTQAKEYRALGYTITDMNGKVLLSPDDDKLRIMELEQENAQLRGQLDALTAVGSKQPKKPAKGRK